MNICEKMINAVKEEAKDAGGTLGFAFYDFRSGESCYLNGDTPLPLASVFKIFLITELFREVDEGKISLDDRVKITKENASPGSGALKRLKDGVELSLHDCAVLMMMLSDNTATDVLFHIVGRDNIKENILIPLGLEKTKIDWDCTTLLKKVRSVSPRRNSPFYLCETEENDQSTPRELTVMLRALHDATILSRETSDKILSLMRPYPDCARLEKYLPVGTKVARKTGSLDRTANDAGIVFTDRGDYAIVVLYNGNTAPADEYNRERKRFMAEELIAKISLAVYRIYTEDETSK